MGKHLHEIDEYPVSVLYEWMMYEAIEPFGDRRGDLQAGIVASTVRNVVHSIVAKQNQWTAPSDFMPNWDRVEEPPPDPEVEYERQLRTFQFLQALQNQRMNEVS